MAYINCDLFRERKICVATGDNICPQVEEPCKLKRSWRNTILVLVGFILLSTFVKTKKYKNEKSRNKESS